MDQAPSGLTITRNECRFVSGNASSRLESDLYAVRGGGAVAPGRRHCDGGKQKAAPWGAALQRSD
jgi:hypothetical protein